MTDDIKPAEPDLSFVATDALMEELMRRFDGVLIVVDRAEGLQGHSHSVSYEGGSIMGAGLAHYAIKYFDKMWEGEDAEDVET